MIKLVALGALAFISIASGAQAREWYAVDLQDAVCAPMEEVFTGVSTPYDMENIIRKNGVIQSIKEKATPDGGEIVWLQGELDSDHTPGSWLFFTTYAGCEDALRFMEKDGSIIDPRSCGEERDNAHPTAPPSLLG